MILVIGLWTFFRAVLFGSAAIALENLALRHRHRYLSAYRARAATRIETAPERRSFPAAWWPDLQTPHGVVIFIRRTSETGTVTLLGRPFVVAPLWPHRLVRCELDLDAQMIRFMRFGAGRRPINRSSRRSRMSFLLNPFTSDREAMALPHESSLLRPRGCGTWPVRL